MRHIQLLNSLIEINLLEIIFPLLPQIKHHQVAIGLEVDAVAEEEVLDSGLWVVFYLIYLVGLVFI